MSVCQGRNGSHDKSRGGVETHRESKGKRMVVLAARQCECAECHRTVHIKMVQMVSFLFSVFYHNFKKSLKTNKAWLFHWSVKSISEQGFLASDSI